MKVEGSSSFATPNYKTVLLVALGFSFIVNAQVLAESDSELGRRIVELYKQGKYQEAIPLAEKLVAVKKQGPEDREAAGFINLLAGLYYQMGDYAKAEPLFQEALRIRRRVLGAEHPRTAASLSNLAELYQVVGDYVKAEPLLEEALRIRQKALGAEHPDTASSLNNLGLLYKTEGDYGKAEPLLQEALRIRQKVLGAEDPDTAESFNGLAELYQALGDYAKAEPLLQEALRIRQNVLGQNIPTRRSASTIWPCCTGPCATTPKPNHS
jgi:tetratricopeptide (TPR) repeat protein